MTLAQRIREHLDSPDAPTDPDARVALVEDLLDRAEPCPTCAGLESALRQTIHELASERERRVVAQEAGANLEAKLARAETPTPDHAALARETAIAVIREISLPSSGPQRYLDVERLILAALSHASQAAPAAPTTEAGPCQHQLRRERAKCRHGYTRGTTCEHCVLSCPKCWDSYSSSESFGPRPVQPTPPPVAPCPSCGSTDGFHTMRNCPVSDVPTSRSQPTTPPAAPSGEQASVFIHALALTTAREHLTDPDTEKRDEQRVFGEAELMDVAMDAIRAYAAAIPPSLSRDVLDMAWDGATFRHTTGGHGPGLFEDCQRPICVEARATLAAVPPAAPPASRHAEDYGAGLAEERRQRLCSCLGSCNGPERLGQGYVCALSAAPPASEAKA